MQFFVIFLGILITISGCTPADVNLSSNYDNLKYKFNTLNQTQSEKKVSSGQSIEISYNTSDTLNEDLKIKINASIDGGFSASDLFENFTNEVIIPKGSKELKLLFKAKSTLPNLPRFLAKISITDDQNSIEFSPNKFDLTLINDLSSPIAPVILSPIINAYYSNEITVNGVCTDNNEVLVNLIDSSSENQKNQSTFCFDGEFNLNIDMTGLLDGQIILNATQINSKGRSSLTAVLSFYKDTVGPGNVDIKINNDAKYTGSQFVSLSLTSADAQEMLITNNSDCITDGNWETYSQSKNWNLDPANSLDNSNNGYSYYVFAKFKDSAGNISDCATSSIKYYNLAPVQPLPLNFYENIISFFAPTPTTFNGSSDSYTSTVSLKDENNFSITVWIKPDNSNSYYDSNIGHILWQGEAIGDGFGDSIINEQEMNLSIGNHCVVASANCHANQDYDYTYKVLSFFLGNTQKSENPDVINIVTPIDLTKPIPQMITVTVDFSIPTAPIAKIYINGTLADSDTGGSTGVERTSWDTNLTIGKPGTNTRYYQGEFYKTMIHSKVLTANDVNHLCWEKKDSYNNDCGQ